MYRTASRYRRYASFRHPLSPSPSIGHSVAFVPTAAMIRARPASLMTAIGRLHVPLTVQQCSLPGLGCRGDALVKKYRDERTPRLVTAQRTVTTECSCAFAGISVGRAGPVAKTRMGPRGGGGGPSADIYIRPCQQLPSPDGCLTSRGPLICQSSTRKMAVAAPTATGTARLQKPTQ